MIEKESMAQYVIKEKDKKKQYSTLLLDNLLVICPRANHRDNCITHYVYIFIYLFDFVP